MFDSDRMLNFIFDSAEKKMTQGMLDTHNIKTYDIRTMSEIESDRRSLWNLLMHHDQVPGWLKRQITEIGGRGELTLSETMKNHNGEGIMRHYAAVHRIDMSKLYWPSAGVVQTMDDYQEDVSEQDWDMLPVQYDSDIEIISIKRC